MRRLERVVRVMTWVLVGLACLLLAAVVWREDLDRKECEAKGMRLYHPSVGGNKCVR